MKFKEFESSQKLRGGYYTGPDIARFLTDWVLEGTPRSILEPACGDGIFLESLGDASHRGLRRVVGFEIDPNEASAARSKGRTLPAVSVNIHGRDFLQWALSRINGPPQFDGVLGNPPFIRYQYLDAELQARSQQIFQHFGLHFTKRTNAWVPFVLASLALLRPGGRFAMVLPAEILHVLHAKSLRDFMLQVCSRILVLDPNEIWFGETLQGVVLLLAEKKRKTDTDTAKIALTPIARRSALSQRAGDYFGRASFTCGSRANGKWMVALLSHEEQQLVERIGQRPSVRTFREIATVDVGIVTGANKFFLVPDSVVDKYGLQDWAHPMFGRSEHVKGVIYDKRAHDGNRRKGLPCNLIWFNDATFKGLPSGARRYIALGEAQNLQGRYKCRIRAPWFEVPSVYATSVSLLKRSHHFPRLIWNRMKAYTTDTAYRIRSPNISAANLVVAFVNSLTALTTELEGRHYGGGVLELVPSEIERLLIPVTQFNRQAIGDLHVCVSKEDRPDSILARQDHVVLRPLGLKRRECEDLLNAWIRLRERRQRVHAADRTAPTRAELGDDAT